MLFTTSWDDGYERDLKIVELLEKYGLTGTFYVCPKSQHGEKMLSTEQIKHIAERHEIGAHTLTHPNLTAIGPRQAAMEILGSKQWIEDVTGKPCTMFCYPYGAVNPAVRELVEKAHFLGARATKDLDFGCEDRFAMPVTLQVMPFPWRKKFQPTWKILDPLGPLRARFMRLRQLKTPFSAMKSWLNLATYLFEGALHSGVPFFHLYGHSREIEMWGMWKDLEEFLRYVSEHKEHFTATPNSALTSL